MESVFFLLSATSFVISYGKNLFLLKEGFQNILRLIGVKASFIQKWITVWLKALEMQEKLIISLNDICEDNKEFKYLRGIQLWIRNLKMETQLKRKS